jgi:hypothetical protein
MKGGLLRPDLLLLRDDATVLICRAMSYWYNYFGDFIGPLAFDPARELLRAAAVARGQGSVHVRGAPTQ